MSYQQLTSAQASPEVPVNENMAALGQAFAFSHDVTSDTGLVVGITRGRFNGATLADTTVTATDDATNYIVANRSTGACSVSTGTTNWNDTATYGRVGIAVFASGVLTYHDERLSSGGIYDHGAGAAGSDPYDVGGAATGVPSASLVLMRYPFPRAVTFPAGMTNSQGVAATAATAQTDFDLRRNGTSFGTMRFAASGTVASFIAASETAFVAGDVLTVVAPASPDATLANVGFSLAGTR